MLENLLDALLVGKIFACELTEYCLSGHSKMYYYFNEELSFNECLADFDAINKSDKSEQLLSDLSDLVGIDIINFLNYYNEKNREQGHEHR